MTNLVVYKNIKATEPELCHTGLAITASNTVQALKKIGVDIDLKAVIDGYDLWNILLKPEFSGVKRLFMEAPFFDTPFLTRLCTAFPHIHFSIIYHSNLGFLAADIWSTKVLVEQISLQEKIPNFSCAGNCSRFSTSVSKAFKTQVLLLPNIYPLSPFKPRSFTSSIIRIGSFGAFRVLKNLTTSAWAARIIHNTLSKPVELWVSSGRDEGHGSSTILTNLSTILSGDPNLTLVQSPWASWPDFKSTVSRMNLLIQPSYTESFNVVTADGVNTGVPSVVGEAIPWVPISWRANIDDADSVAQTGLSLLNDPHSLEAYNKLKQHNLSAISLWTRAVL